MSLKKYFDILGLPVTASDREIKTAYRKLAMRFHPDRNSDPQSRDKFILITKAYDILMSPNRKIIEQQSTRTAGNTGFSSTQREPTREERIKKARNRQEAQKAKEKRANERYYQSMISGRRWGIMNLISKVGAVIGLLLLLESLLPYHQIKDELIAFEMRSYNGFKYDSINLIRTEKGDEIYLAGLDFGFANDFPSILVVKSWLFHNPIRVVSNDPKYRGYSFPVDWSVQALFPWLSFLFFLPLVTVYYKRKTILFTVMYHVSLYGVGILLVYFIFTENRWAHALTLGFL